MQCPACQATVLEIDVKCASCGTPLGTTGAHQLIGKTLLGQYQVVEVLGQGGMSVVYRAIHAVTFQEVALKVLPPDLAAVGQVKSRFLEEAKALAQLDHPHIVHLYNFGSENGSLVLAMQFVAGSTWERLIVADDGQRWPDAVRIAIDVLRALEYAHARGIVHRDMKPSNVLVRATDGTATVMDFGIAKMTSSTRLTAVGQTMGTVRYMSPEQVRGHEVDLRTDLYSLGASLYEAIAGDTPFSGDTHFEIMSKHLTEAVPSLRSLGRPVPEALDQLLIKAMAKRPAERPATARELRKELEAILRDSGEDAEVAETQRISRRGLATRPPPRTAALVSGGGPGASPSASPTAVHAGPGAADASDAALVAPVSESVVAAAVPSATAARSRGAGLWLGLGLAVAVAAGVVVVLAVRGSPRPARPFAASPEPAPPTVVTWGAAADFAELRLRVRVARGVGVAPESVAAAFRRARAALPAVLAARNLSASVFPDPVTVGVVPVATFCEPALYDGEAPHECTRTLHYFRIKDPILLVADRAGLLDQIVAQAVAEISCTYNAVEPCFGPDLIEAVKGTPRP